MTHDRMISEAGAEARNLLKMLDAKAITLQQARELIHVPLRAAEVLARFAALYSQHRSMVEDALEFRVIVLERFEQGVRDREFLRVVKAQGTAA